MTAAPRVDIDIFSEEVLADPWPVYRTIRDMAPVVHLVSELYDAYAVSRFDDVRAVLSDWRRFTSTQGVGFNDVSNSTSQGTIIGQDPPEHTALRKVMNERLRLSEVKELTRVVQAQADKLVAELLEQQHFDAVSDLARRYVPTVVGELVGLEGDALHIFAAGGNATFEVFGPPNERMQAGVPILLEQLSLVGALTKADMLPGSMGWHVYDAAERGEIPEGMSTALLFNYVGPGFDTTICAIANSLWFLARDPEQWKLFKDGTTTVAAVINETLRIEPPITQWGRFSERETEVDGITIPAQSRLAVLIGSANHDERHYSDPDPDRFDARRNPLDHLGLGHGIHSCIGANLAKAQMTAVLTAVVEQVTDLECGEAVRRLNNTTRGLGSLPVSWS